MQLLGPRLHLVGALSRSVAPWRDFLALRELVRLFRERRYDVVHTHMTKAGILGRVAAVVAGVPVIVHTEHGLSLHHSRHVIARRCFDAFQRVGAHCSDAVLVVSNADLAVARDEIGIPEHLLADGRQGVDVPVAQDGERARARHLLGVDPRAPLYGTVSRLVPSKRIDDLVAAAAVVAGSRPEAQAVVVASGPEEGALRSLAARLAIDDRITFLPARDDIAALLPAFDVFVHPSDFEGLPMVVLEAVAAGVPVVAEAAAGTGEVVVDHVTGRLVEIGDVDGLAHAIIDLLDDPAYARQLAEEGRRFVQVHHDAAGRAGIIESLYTDLLASGVASSRRMGPMRMIRSVLRPAPAASRETSPRV